MLLDGRLGFALSGAITEALVWSRRDHGGHQDGRYDVGTVDFGRTVPRDPFCLYEHALERLIYSHDLHLHAPSQTAQVE
jgi:hypothetical protein